VTILENSCGECGMCCRLLAIESLEKPPGPTCRHFGCGCSIYDDRPDECRGFRCLWLKSERLPPEARLGPAWRPDHAKFIMYTDRGGLRLNVVLDPDHPWAWREEPYISFIESQQQRAIEGFEVLIYSAPTGLSEPAVPQTRPSAPASV